MAYDPNEPRDQDGKWTSGGGGGKENKSSYKKKVLSEIAKEHLDIDTLETRNHDSLDFHDLSAEGVKRALTSAYEAGRNNVTNKGKGEHGPIISKIAREELDLETLETRGRDSLDFHEHSVAGVSSALDRAYEAGKASGDTGSVHDEEMNYKASSSSKPAKKSSSGGSVNQEEANYKIVGAKPSVMNGSKTWNDAPISSTQAIKSGGKKVARDWNSVKPGDRVQIGDEFRVVYDTNSTWGGGHAVKTIKNANGDIEEHVISKKAGKAITLELSREDGPYFLRSASVRLSREQRPGHLPPEIAGVPCFYKSREAVRCGTYIDGRGRNVTITPQMLDHMVAEFNRMKDAGVKVPLPTKHPRPGDNLTELNRGYVYGMKREGDSLKINMQLIGDDAVRTAARSELSIGVSNFNAAGKRFENAIDHVALVVDPVVTGLGNLEPAFVASRDAANDGISEFIFSASHDQLTGDDDMSLSESAKAAVINILGDDTPDVLNADTAIAALANYVGGLHGKLNLSRSAEDYTKLENDLRAANARIAELSRQESPEILAGFYELSAERIDNAVQAGDMPKFVGEFLKKDLGTAEKPSGFMLSRNADFGDRRPVEYILSMFKGTRLGASNEGRSKTGVQVLSRNVPGDDAPAKIEDNPLIKEAQQALGIKK